jgi:hypothetical protein
MVFRQKNWVVAAHAMLRFEVRGARQPKDSAEAQRSIPEQDQLR